jgi:hypothetical protein
MAAVLLVFVVKLTVTKAANAKIVCRKRLQDVTLSGAGLSPQQFA